jgi:hypothetical protein
MYQVLGKKVATILPQNFSPVAEANEWLTLLVPLFSAHHCGNQKREHHTGTGLGRLEQVQLEKTSQRVTLSWHRDE